MFLHFQKLLTHEYDNVIVICFQESNLEFDYEQKEPFLELHRILEALKVKDLEPALRSVLSCVIFKIDNRM